MILCATALHLLIFPEQISAADWSLAGLSAFSSSYHTQTWNDSLRIEARSLLGVTWGLSQRLDLLRKRLSTGPDLRQRQLHALATAQSPLSASLDWKVDLDGDESSITEPIDRRIMWSRFLAGGNWHPWTQAFVEAQAGAITSSHRTGGGNADDQGFARRIGLGWNGKGFLPAGAFVRSSLTHEGDDRERVPSQETKLSIETNWARPADSISAGWAEQWGDVRFFPSPDRFDLIGRQQRRIRDAQVRWQHMAVGGQQESERDRRPTLGWILDANYGLNQNTYEAALVPGQSAFIPGDARTLNRAYTAAANSRWGPVASSLEYHYRWTQDRFGEVRRDQTGETGEMDALLSGRVTRFDSVGVRAIFRVTSYTVPADSGFFDDRDQAERVVETFWCHRFSPTLVIRPVFSFQRERQIFLSERRSADNNTNDIYVLAPVVVWNLTSFVLLQQTFAIRAHYRYFDFERTDPLGRGTLYRRGESITDARIARTPGMTWTLRYTYRYEDFGGLYDRAGWVQAVDWDRRSNLVDFRTSWRLAHGFVLEPGVALEYKRSFNHRREGDQIRRVEDKPFWRRQLGISARWESGYGYHVSFSLAQRVQDSGLGGRDLDDRWEFSLSKDVM